MKQNVHESAGRRQVSKLSKIARPLATSGTIALSVWTAMVVVSGAKLLRNAFHFLFTLRNISLGSAASGWT